MGKRDYFAHGDYNVICDLCGQKYKASECKLQWNNYLACPDCFEIRNPQDFVKGVRDNMQVPLARPDQSVNFITTPVTPEDL